MPGQQFFPVPINCPNCGFHMGEQAYFQSFEQKAAGWLKGNIAPVGTKGYDIKGVEGFPDLTFQVKYCTAHPYQPKNKHAPQLVWVWVQKIMPTDTTPDFFILFGLFENGEEYVFLINKEDFIKESRKNSKGQYVYRTSAKRFNEFRRAGMPAKIYYREITDPEKNLINAVVNYQQGTKEPEWVGKLCIICNDPTRPHYGKGMCHRCYQKNTPYKNLESYNENRRIKYHGLKPIPTKSLSGWARYHECCVICGTTENKHYGHGKCAVCYQKIWHIQNQT